MNHRIYLDMDGVIARWLDGSLAVHGKLHRIGEVTMWDFFGQVDMTAEDYWQPLRNVDFWANLDTYEDGMELWRKLCVRFDVERIGFLSSPGCPGSPDGKRLWLDKHFPKGWSKKAIFTERKEQCAAPCKLLVDDYEKNVDTFVEHGGKAVLIPRLWNRRRGECDSAGAFDPEQLFDEVVKAAW